LAVNGNISKAIAKISFLIVFINYYP